jgi:hypothetical protein
MKTVKLLIIAAFFAVAQQGYAQDCPDEVSTDPRNPLLWVYLLRCVRTLLRRSVATLRPLMKLTI